MAFGTAGALGGLVGRLTGRQVKALSLQHLLDGPNLYFRVVAVPEVGVKKAAAGRFCPHVPGGRLQSHEQAQGGFLPFHNAL